MHQTKNKKWKIMSKEHVKLTLLKMLSDFDIENHFEVNGDMTQSFEHQVGFEYQGSGDDSDSEWHEAWMDIAGTIYIKPGFDDYHNPLNDGRLGENQGETNSIDDWNVDAVRVYVDGEDVSGLISLDDVAKRIEELEKCQA